MRILLATLTGADDPREVLTGRYGNAHNVYAVLRELAWPPFVDRRGVDGA